jgi:hypothetical protein
MRPFLRGGAIWFSDDDIAVGASFSDGPSAAGGFTVDAVMDQWQAVAVAGFDVVTANDNSLKFKYEGRFGDLTTNHSVTLKGSARF